MEQLANYPYKVSGRQSKKKQVRQVHQEAKVRDQQARYEDLRHIMGDCTKQAQAKGTKARSTKSPRQAHYQSTGHGTRET